MGKMMKYLFVICLTVLACALSFSQGSFDKAKLLEMYQKGAFEKMSASEVRQMLSQYGISEQEAIRMAKENNIDFSKYLTQGSAAPAEVTKVQLIPVPTTGQLPVVTPEVTQIPPSQPRDTTRVTGAYGLEYFGYDIFKHVPAAFELTAVGPIDPGYLVGPEDALLISVWGQAEFRYELEVDREGKVFIPNVGQVFVMGTPLRDLERKLRNQLSKYYSGLASSPPTVFMDVTISKLRPLRVFVMGEVKHPGGYTINSYATVFNALYAVGGPLVRGSLRNIKVIRDGKVVAAIDLYDYLLRGDKTNDVRLQNNDVIFVPPRVKTVVIRGEIRRPAIYELKEQEQLNALFTYCGGLQSTAYLDNAQIDRVKPFAERSKGVEDRLVVDLNLKDVINKNVEDVTLFDDDEIQIFSVLEEKRNFVEISGSVWRPGRYELGEVGTVRDLIAAAKGIQPKTYLDLAHLTRLNDDLISWREIPFDLKKVLGDPANDIKLMPRDVVNIFSIEAVEVRERYVSIYGEVKSSGRFPLRDGMTLSDLILQAGGFTEEANVLEAEVSRLRPTGVKGDSLVIILHPSISNDFSLASRTPTNSSVHTESGLTAGDFMLQHNDQVLIVPNPNFRLQQNVSISGDVTFPGTYAIKKRGERLSEMLDRAGGLTKTSYLGGAEFKRGGKRLLLDFEKAYQEKDLVHDVVLLAGDAIHFPSTPHTVTVGGEVNAPGLLSFIKGNSVSDYIDRAGGLTDSANYAVLMLPTGESKRVNFGWFRHNPEVADGANIIVYRTPPPSPEEAKGVDWGVTIKDTFAILTSAATLAYIVYQVTNK